jgi:PAS domain S-box-containing protein
MEDNEEKHLRSVALANAQAVLRARERAEEALRASEEQFRAVFNQTTGGIAQTDLTGRFTLVNDRYCDIVGRSREELLSLRMQDITHPDDASANAEQFRALVHGGPSFVVEKRYVRPDGSIVWVHNDVSAMRDSRGHVSHAVAAVTDITERKQTEQQLHHSEQELADFFENATVGLHWVGPDGIILRANRAELNLLGYAADEYVGHHIAEFHADQDAIGDILRRLTAGEELHGYEARLRCKDGSVRHVLISSNVLWEDDRFVHTRCFTRDITERKQAEKALRESETYTRQLLDSSPDCVKVLDLDGRLISINPAGLKMLEVSDDASLLNHDWTEFWTDADRAAARQALVTA